MYVLYVLLLCVCVCVCNVMHICVYVIYIYITCAIIQEMTKKLKTVDSDSEVSFVGLF